MSLRIIVFSGDPSLNDAMSFCSQINFALSMTPIHRNMSLELGIEQSTIYWRQTVAIFPLSERIVNNLQSEDIGPASTDVM